MAFFEDKNKPVDIYKPGTSTAQAQNSMGNAVGRGFQSLANLADKYAGGKGARQLGNFLMDSAEDPKDRWKKKRKDRALSKLNDMPQSKVPGQFDDTTTGNEDRGGSSYLQTATSDQLPADNPQPTSLDNPVINEQPNDERDRALGKMTSNAEALPDGGQKNTYSIGENSISYDLSPHDLKIKKSIEAIDARIAEGFEPTPEQAERIAAIRQQAGFTRGGTDRRPAGTDRRPAGGGGGERRLGNQNNYKRGNLDIEFDDSVAPADRERFLEDPTRPTAQIDRYNAKQKQNRGGMSQGQLASANANRVLNGTPEQEKRGWQARLALDKQAMENEQSGANVRATLASLEKRAAGDNKVYGDRTLSMANTATNTKNTLQPKVIKVSDGMGGTIDQIMLPGADGKYRNAMGITPKKATKAKMIQMRDSNDPDLDAAEAEYRERFGELPY